MRPGITIAKLWEDSELVELRVSVSDGVSEFTNQVYVSHSALARTVEDLDGFKGKLGGGLLDIQFGEFGPDWANGAFHAKFQLLPPGRTYVTAQQESEFIEFANKLVASRATLHMTSEPGLLDRFIAELRAVSSKASVDARLEGIING